MDLVTALIIGAAQGEQQGIAVVVGHRDAAILGRWPAAMETAFS